MENENTKFSSFNMDNKTIQIFSLILQANLSWNSTPAKLCQLIARLSVVLS